MRRTTVFRATILATTLTLSAGAHSLIVIPTNLTVTQGLFTPTGPTPIQFQDAFFTWLLPVGNPAVAQFVAEGTYVGPPPSLSFQVMVNSRHVGGGNGALRQRIEVFNWVTTSWEVFRDDPMFLVFNWYTFTQTQSPGNYVSSTGLIRTRVTVRQVSPFVGHTRFDVVNWDVL